MRNSKGQNIAEYVLLVAAVLAVCASFLTIGGPMSQAVNGSLYSIVNQINNAPYNASITLPAP